MDLDDGRDPHDGNSAADPAAAVDAAAEPLETRGIIVSERGGSPASPRPYLALAPARVSEPMSKKLAGWPGSVAVSRAKLPGPGMAKKMMMATTKAP